MAFNLAQAAKLEKYDLAAGIMMNLLRDAPLLNYLSFENVSSFTSIALRWTSLPSVAFRRVNEGYATSEGDVEQVYESVYGFGGDMEIDRVFDKVSASMVKDPRSLLIEMKSKSMALHFNDYFINGDHATEPDGFEGLKKRISNMPSRQSVRASATTDILDPTASAGNARRFLDKLEEAHYKANSGQVDVILANEGMVWGLGRALRYASSASFGMIDMTQDGFGREFLSYKGAPLIDAGLKRDQVTEVISAAETAEDAGTDATSMYFVPVNMEHGIYGIQLGPMEIYDPLDGAEQASKPTRLIRVEWWCGLAGFGSYGPVRLHNIETPANWT